MKQILIILVTICIILYSANVNAYGASKYDNEFDDTDVYDEEVDCPEGFFFQVYPHGQCYPKDPTIWRKERTTYIPYRNKYVCKPGYLNLGIDQCWTRVNSAYDELMEEENDKDNNKLDNFDESDEDVDRCDAGYFPGRAPGNSLYEVNEDCYDKCYQVCFERGINGKVPGWRTQPCRNNCEEKCNRCNKYVYDQLPKIRNCPVPECLIKDEAWNKCVNDVHYYVGGTGTQYFDHALKILRRNGISTDKYQISYLYCRCATQGSTEEACQYFPPPMKKRSKLRGADTYDIIRY
jgi:hypothetical protein